MNKVKVFGLPLPLHWTRDPDIQTLVVCVPCNMQFLFLDSLNVNHVSLAAADITPKFSNGPRWSFNLQPRQLRTLQVHNVYKFSTNTLQFEPIYLIYEQLNR